MFSILSLDLTARISSFIYKFIVQNQASRPNSGGIFNNSLVVVLLIGIVLLLIGLFVVLLFLVYKFMKREKKSEQFNESEKKIVTSQKTEREEEIVNPLIKSKQWEILSLEEKHILNVLVENKGNFLQKNLSSTTDYSKSTITRILTRLEDQDLIYRVPAGRGYRVFIKNQQL